MRSVAALLAAVLALAAGGCGSGGGAEPGASRQATVVLDFQPNAVHAGIYAALREGYYRDAGIDLRVQVPSSSTDAPKLLEAGRADFAILDIHDLAIARERGLELVGVAPIVERPLASVIARDPQQIRNPGDLAGRTVGVTGLPSDNAVLSSTLQSQGVAASSVHTVTIGFNAVASLAAGRVDAATAFWNAEGVTLRRRGIPIRVFRVDDFGAPRYPELILTTTAAMIKHHAGLVRSVVDATRRGYGLAGSRPHEALDDLLATNPSLDRGDERAQLGALNAANAFRPAATFTGSWLRTWPAWEADHGIVSKPVDIHGLLSLAFQPG
jgi:NitT/TauT family transport system substrate-binding protein/putative hydroxymethylpyrimidine transport system substrate-binding protein